MYTFTVENKYGQQLELTHNPNYDITEIDGLDPPEAIINTTRNANADGSVFNSSYVTDRQIIITLAINSPAEANRINLYKYFKSKFPVTLYYQNATRNVYINGYVKNIEIAFFDKKQIAQITVFCPQPLFNGVDESLQEFSSIESLFEFPFEVAIGTNLIPYPYYNPSKTANGITWTINSDGTITANGTATARTDFFMAYNVVGLFGYGDYIFSGCPDGGSNSTYKLQLYDATNRVTYNDLGEGVIFTIDENNESSQFRILASIFEGVTVNNIIFKPIINAGSTAEEYTPYTAPQIEFSAIETNTEQSIVNNGDVDTGVIITIHANGTVDTPKIYNVDTNESMIINVTMAEGDDIVINTRKGQKSITLTSNGVTTNIIGSLADGSTWFQLVPTDNVFTIAADDFAENMQVSFTIIDQYEGV